MTARLWEFAPLDVFFFRDASPYNAGEGGWTGAGGFFPPFMSTLQGAVRTALAYGRGWRPERPDMWPGELGGPDDPGRVVLRGPYLFSEGEILLPAPLNILCRKDAGDKRYHYIRLVPGPAVECDLGLVRLPEPTENAAGATELQGAWLSGQGMAEVLAGGLPGDGQVFQASALWREEPRVGIERDRRRRTAVEHKLYSATFTRLCQGVSLQVEVSGLTDEWYDGVPAVIPLGGEGRLARIRIAEQGLDLPELPAVHRDGDKIRFTVTLITSGSFPDVASAVRNGPPEVPGRCVAACTGRMQQSGGWDLKSHAPRPLRPLIPAGSTWFFETEGSRAAEVQVLHGKCLGDGQAWGLGQVLIGRWEEKT